MESKEARAEIVVDGLVQGVGYRYFVYRNAAELRLKGYTKNLYTGEVITVVEGEKHLIEELYYRMKIGPSHADVRKHRIKWYEPKYEFKNFEIGY